MNIAYILYPEVVISNKSNGIRSQAETWALDLRMLGHKVDLVNNWDNYDWKSYDIIHLFGCSGSWQDDVSRRLANINPNICFSPIIDPKPVSLEKISKVIKDKVRENFPVFRNIRAKKYPFIKQLYARTDCEFDYLSKVQGVDSMKIAKVPLSFTPALEEKIAENVELGREQFCLHISSLTQKRKNVISLIKAAKKYDFKLVLAGNMGTEKEFEVLKKAIGNNANIEVLGYISEEKKIELYKKAKVFALPSFYEGVGIVAVDAALMGCEIVVTDIPGPKEYYAGMASVVNPYNVDEIGLSIKERLNGVLVSQPKLSEYIYKEFSPNRVVKLLIDSYRKLL